MTTKQEEVIKFLLSIERKSSNNTIVVDVGKNNFNIEDMSENELVSILSELEILGFVKLKWLTKNREDLSYYIPIEIKSPMMTYFNDKKSAKSKRIIDVIKWLIPTIISIIALVISILKP